MKKKITDVIKRLVRILLVLSIVALIALRRDIVVRNYVIQNDNISSPVRLMLLTDLHSSNYGKNQQELIKVIDELSPDIILLGGDIADDKVAHDRTWQLLDNIGRRYPCYYVSGNHEYWSGEIGTIKENIASYGVRVLEGETLTLDVRGETIQLCGIDDPEHFGSFGVSEEWAQELDMLSSELESGIFSILLSHRPEAVGYYKNSDFDLILCGHAHGGQVRIPYILNGLYAPNQGAFPKYAGGYYDLGTNEMIVSRGLCRNYLPRIFNRPEVVVVEIK